MGTLLTISEVAERLRIGRTAAYGLCRQPGFPAARVGRQHRVSEAELEAWLREQHPATDIALQAGTRAEGESR